MAARGGGGAMDDPGFRRVYFIDWLRILAVLLLFPFHTLRVFNTEPFYVKAATLSTFVDGVLDFISLWHMPLLFFLAGCSTYFALKKRSGGQYAWERVKRLLVPFVFGVLVLVPPQTWYGARFNSAYTGSYWDYLSSGGFLSTSYSDDYFGGLSYAHLWFILYLFFISLVVLPLLLWGARGRGIGKMQAFSRRLAWPVWWLLPIVILFVAQVVPKIDDRPVLLFLVVFLFGFVAMCDPKCAESAQRYRWPAFVGGVALTLFWVLWADFRNSLPDPSWGRSGLVLLGMAALWLMLMGAMGLGKRYLDRTSRTQKYLAESSYPVYILHQTVIVIIAFYVVELAVPGAVQWVLLLIAAVAGTFALYEIVRRVGVLRFLFGMRQRKRAERAAQPQPAPAGTRRPEV
jgi:glucan biosynthesis protein C